MIRKFVFIIDGEVGPDLTFEDGSDDLTNNKFEQNRALAAAFLSNPIIVEIPYDSEVEMGWIWDGKTFKNPTV